MTTPVPSAQVGPFHRSLVEALECVAAREQVRVILRSALLNAQLEAVPEESRGFAAFVNGALTLSLERTLGAGAAETLCDQLAHLLALATPRVVARQATGTEDADELSGERVVDAPPPMPRASHTSHTASKPNARPDIAAALQGPRSIPKRDSMPPLVAPVLFPPRATSFESGTQQKRSGARVTSDPRASARTSRPSVEEIHGPTSGARALATDVIVVSLDPRLSGEVEARLRGRSRVVGVISVTDLKMALAAAEGGRVAVVLDTGVPSIDVPTLVSLELPPSTHVVLWGTDPRHKARLVAMFPQVRSWVASGAAESPVDLLVAESER